ncbi:MAG: hypothetical protein ABSG92_05995 [Conexivisphaerales archaeon]
MLQQRRLPGAVPSYDGQDLSRVDVQAYVVQGDYAVGLLEPYVPELDYRQIFLASE